MAAQVPVRVEGLDEFRRAIRALDPRWGRALSKIHRQIAKQVTTTARAKAPQVGRSQARMAMAIKASGTQSAAKIRVDQSTRFPWANPAFWGQIKRSGWYERVWAESHSGRAQALPWVGADWDVGVKGEGPYAINDAIAQDLPKVMEGYERMIHDLFRQVFTD